MSPADTEHIPSPPSPAASPAGKALHLITANLPSSLQSPSHTPTGVSPADTEHVPSPPPSSGRHPFLRSLPSHSVAAQCSSLQGLQPAELAARLDELTERYDLGVDEVGAQIAELQRQLMAHESVSSTSALEALPSADSYAVGRTSRSVDDLQAQELMTRLEVLMQCYDRCVDQAGAEVLRLQQQLHAARRRSHTTASFDEQRLRIFSPSSSGAGSATTVGGGPEDGIGEDVGGGSDGYTDVDPDSEVL